MSGANNLRKRKSTQSLRNELNQEEKAEYEKYVETDFEKWSKEDLEAEVKALRKQMWKDHQSMNEDLRDMLSHGATGRAMDSADADLQLNQTSSDETKKTDFNAVLAKAGKRALGGGTSGAISMVVTVFSLMVSFPGGGGGVEASVATGGRGRRGLVGRRGGAGRAGLPHLLALLCSALLGSPLRCDAMRCGARCPPRRLLTHDALSPPTPPCSGSARR